MPCPDFVSARPEKSVPPKKSHSWRSHSITSPDQQTSSSVLEPAPYSGETASLNMGSHTVPPESQNVNGHRIEQLPPPRNFPEDMPLDFSLKSSESKLPLPGDAKASQVGRPGGLSPYEYPFRLFNGNHQPHHTPNETHSQFASNTIKKVHRPMKTAVSPKRDINSDSFDINNSEDPTDFDPRSSPRLRIKSPGLHSPGSSSKSPILAGMLTRNPSDVLPVMPVDVLNSRLMSLGYQNQNGYPNGLSPLCVPAGIQSPNSVIPNPAIFTPGMAFMQSQMNMLNPVSSLQAECRGPRKLKKERPFKNYDVSLQDGIPCNNISWAGSLPQIVPHSIDTSSDARHSEPRNVSHSSAVNGSLDSSSNNSDPPSAASEVDNVPHSSVPSNSPPDGSSDTAKARNRKRKPVADSQKDDSYWERRKKNNQAAKRSRENRRIKEDTVAQQALFFRSETTRMAQVIMHITAQVQDISQKCASLEQDKLALTAENAMIKQIISQKMCLECGNYLLNKMLEKA